MNSTIHRLITVDSNTHLIKHKVSWMAVLVTEQLVNALADFDMAGFALNHRQWQAIDKQQQVRPELIAVTVGADKLIHHMKAIVQRRELIEKAHTARATSFVLYLNLAAVNY